MKQFKQKTLLTIPLVGFIILNAAQLTLGLWEIDGLIRHLVDWLLLVSIISIIVIVVWILVKIWTVKRKGSLSHKILWTVLMLFFLPIGFMLYVWSGQTNSDSSKNAINETN